MTKLDKQTCVSSVMIIFAGVLVLSAVMLEDCQSKVEQSVSASHRGSIEDSHDVYQKVKVGELETLQRGDIVETHDGNHFVPLVASSVPIFRKLAPQKGCEGIHGVRIENVRRIIRHDDPEAKVLWMQARPVPKEEDRRYYYPP